MSGKDWMSKYEDMLEDINVTYKETVDFVKTYMPNKLFAYRKFDAFWRKNLFEGQIHLVPASNFNDPFDCAPMFDLIHNKSKMGRTYMKYCSNPTPDFRNKKQKIDKVIEELKGRIQEDIKVSCFTERNDSILMWSYYTLNHQGFCVEYDTSKHFIFNNLVLPVIYKRERYNATNILVTRNENLVMNPVFYKAEDWKHEEEWRVALDSENPVYPYDEFMLKEAISAVYLGANAEKNNNWKAIEKEIQEWGKTNNIPVYKMRLHDTKYEINWRLI